MSFGNLPANFDHARDEPVSTSAFGSEVDRPPSPAPSYHTLPPATHASLASAQQAGNLRATSNSLLSIARHTPDAILSILTLTNHTTPNHPTGATGAVHRHLSARTADGRERYRVGSCHGGTQSLVWRDQGTQSSLDNASDREVLASLTGGSQTRSVFLSTEGQHFREDALAVLDYNQIQDTGNLPLPNFTVGSQQVDMQWEITTLSDFPSTSSNVSLEDSIEDGRRRSAHAVLRKPHQRWKGLDRHEHKRSNAGLSSLHLVDGDYSVYVEYDHSIGVPDLAKDGEQWGTMKFRARSMLIDVNGETGGAPSKRMDQAFLTLILLLEAYVRPGSPSGPF